MAVEEGFVEDRCFAQIFDLVDDVDFCQLVHSCVDVCDEIQRGLVFEIQVFDLDGPVFDHSRRFFGLRCLDTAAAVVATNDDVFDFDFESKL